MSKRYGTLDVSLNMSRSGPHKTHKTIEAFTERDDEESSKTENEEKVNKFKELYYKNERLRRELKSLNEKLNEKLDKLKLPSVKRKTMSVDLNKTPIRPPPSKAIVRELENGYKQIAMYKKRVEVLKNKQETPENYEKLRNTENMVNYMNLQIERVQQELISIKNIRKIQERALSEDVDNVELKQRVNDYLREIKGYKDKMKEIDKKSRKRETQFKKQQAYLVALKAKIRKDKAEEEEMDRPEPQKPKQIPPQEFNQAKQELRMSKTVYQTSVKKVESMRVHVKKIKSQKVLFDEQFKQKQALYKLLLVNVESYARLLKDLQIKKYEQTGVRPEDKDDDHTKILKLQQIEDQPQQSEARVQKVWREEN